MFGPRRILPRTFSDPLAPAAPVMTWDTDGTDNTPTFTADFDDTLIASGDIIHLQWSTDPSFNSPNVDTDTLDAGEISAGEVAFTTGTLADGVWYARCRHQHIVGGVNHFSPWSNTVTQTISTSTPRSYTYLGSDYVPGDNTTAAINADIGTATATRVVLIAIVSTGTDPSTVTVGGQAASQIQANGQATFYSYVGSGAGSGTQDIIVDGFGAWQTCGISVWVMDGLASTTYQATNENASQTCGITTASGDYVFSVVHTSGTPNFNGSTETPDGARQPGTAIMTADWEVSTTGTFNSVLSHTPNRHLVVSFR